MYFALSNRSKRYETVCYILHTRPYEETSLIVDAICYDFGRISFIAKGAKRINNALKSQLQIFTPLKITIGNLKNSLKTFYTCQQLEQGYQFMPPRLFSALYINELVCHLYKVGEESKEVFNIYMKALASLNNENISEELTLRQFEISFLRALGIGIDFKQELFSGNPIQANVDYCYHIDGGFVAARNFPYLVAEGELVINGKLLQKLSAKYVPNDPSILRLAKIIMNKSISNLLVGKKLRSKELYREFLKTTGNN